MNIYNYKQKLSIFPKSSQIKTSAELPKNEDFGILQYAVLCP